ncbi:hypothetical protein ACFQ0K_11125 [Nocardioides caeni]|uniref:Uncharacterized protein n=1 Tax=Nocardioides caeni TaxID=574700 RepID=A0A4S8NLY1_9ACTN|nr:hypothetical protein [Nocardioides caeni]THV17987.1 hypothetical protein E9934_05945 [Nocardioides caeni]
MLLALGCAVLGAAVSVCVVALHGYVWGLLLGLAATAAMLVALPGGPLRLGFAAGWALVLAVAAPARAEGDYLVAGDVPGYALLVSGIVVFAAGFAGLVRRPPLTGDSGDSETSP